jgi:hypothetical protein
MNKYKLNEQLLDTRGGAEKLKRDGFTQSQIIDYMYKATPGVSQPERTELIKRLYERQR